MNRSVNNNLLSFFRSGRLHRQQYFSLFLSLPTIALIMNAPPTSTATKMFPDVSLPTVDIIRNNGYQVEVHNVTTEDGYILELHRIPRSKSGQEPTRNHPVFIHHGILGSSADWVLGGANMSLPMQLADDGYDVWLANCRGNTYSRKHVSLSWKQKGFWNFSLHEIGTYDLPASIDYILKNTNVSQLHYIGYSMGTCVFFIMASEKPEYQSKIRSQISLAPVAYLSNTRSALRYIAPYARIINMIFQKMSSGMIMPQSRFQTFLASTICREKMTQKLICEKYIIFSVCGSDPYYFDSKMIPYIMGHFPAGTSAKLASHFAQFILKESFGQFDYGPVLNVRHYNSTEPPTYDLKSINVPITLIYGENDLLADEEDVMRLKAQLPMLMDAFPVKSPYCNHVDFLWSLKVKEFVNDPIKGILRKTDDMSWRYTGPDPSIVGNEIGDADRKGTYHPVARPPPGPIRQLDFTLGMDYFLENLDAIIESTMPRVVDDNDTVDFDREREHQKILFGHVIRSLKAAGKKYGQLRDGVAYEVEDWTDSMAIGVTGARNVVEKHVADTAVLVNGKIAVAGKAVASGIVKTESHVANGMNVAEKFVVGGVAKAEQTVVNGIAKAEHYVSFGLNKADHAVVNTVNTTLKGLNRALWFLKFR